MHRMLLAIIVALIALPAQAADGDPLRAADLGPRRFHEDFATFDQGQDQKRPARPHRWRTVYGSGGPLSFDNRKMSGTSIATDAAFAGVIDGRPGPRPLGLDPYEHRPGLLTILARPTPERLRPLLWNAAYYSGAMTTKFSFSQLFGYFEIEARLPVGKGLWPAFWLMPVTGRWPQDGEIDIMEGLGHPNEIYTTVHFGDHEQRQRKVELPFDVSQGFHTYGLLWGPRTLVWYVDRREVFRTPTPPALTRTPMYMIANLAVGGAWGGQPDASTRFPAAYAIRRVSAWAAPAER